MRWFYYFSVILLSYLVLHASFDHKPSFSLPNLINKIVTTCLNDLTILPDSSNELLYKSHVNACWNLIRSDIQVKNEEDTREKQFPKSYVSAIDIINGVITQLEEINHPTLSCVRLIKKKEGLPKNGSEIHEKWAAVRDIIEVKRRSERVLSEILILLISYRNAAENGLEDDLLFFVKVLLENVAVQDRHLELLVLCKGLISPNYKLDVDIIDVQTLLRSPRPSLLNSYKNGMLAVHRHQFPTNARLLFPLAVVCLRCNSYVKTRGLMDEQCVEKDYMPEDLRFCKFLGICMSLQENHKDTSILPCALDEILSSLFRWINDIIALYLINANPISSSLPEEIKKNTIAMEILCTLPAFSEGRKQDREGYFACLSEIGSYLDVIISRAIDKEVEEVSLQEIIKDTKVMMATVSMIKSLPDKHRLKNKLQWRLGSLALRKDKVIPSKQKSSVNKRLLDGFSVKPQGSTTKTVMKRYGALTVNRVSDPFPTNDNVKIKNNTTSIVKVQDNMRSVNESRIEEITETFYEIVADILKVNMSEIQRLETKSEIEHIFTTWRRPHLLLDYYRIHASTPELQNLYRRFLKALFAVSEETFEDIRFGDKYNKCHLDRFPSDLITIWRDGSIHRENSVTFLPGYNDPQTLFMLGEDCTTCMAIRPKQKNTNRGLLSFVLHGNVRVIGPKDKSGIMLARAIVQLLIDDTTNSPVLYMHSPQGDVNKIVEVYDDAAELGRILRIPVIYAVPPPEERYILSDGEVNAASSSNREMLPLCDYSCLAPFAWIEGVKKSFEGKYLTQYPPQLLKTNLSEARVTAGVRSVQSIEHIQLFGRWEMPVYIPATSEEKSFQEKVEPVLRTLRDREVREVRVTTGQAKPKLVSKNKVSVQARLADRQRWISEDQQSRRAAAVELHPPQSETTTWGMVTRGRQIDDDESSDDDEEDD